MSTTSTEEVTTPTDKKSSKTILIVGAVILGLLIIAGGTGAIIYYTTKKEDDDDVPTYVIDQESAILTVNPVWPACTGQLFVNQTAKKLYSIDVKFSDEHNYGPTHVELYFNKIDTHNLIAKSITKDAQGWTTFDFTSYPVLQTSNSTYIFMVVPDNDQALSIWYDNKANLGLGRKIWYNIINGVYSEDAPGSSLTFRLSATT